MIVVDGDSVAVMIPNLPSTEKKWPYLLGRSRGVPSVSIATHKATSRDCLLRFWRVVALRPKWYVLCLGQWSQNHEPVDEFEANLRKLIEALHLERIKVCLMTPPVDVGYLQPYLAVLRKLSLIYCTGLLDVNLHLAADDVTPQWWEPDSSIPCHFSELGAKRLIGYFDMQPDLCAA